MRPRNLIAIFLLSAAVCGAAVFVLSRVLGQQDRLASGQAAAQTEQRRLREDRARVAAALVVAQRDACQRSNAVRDELNARVRAHSIDRAVLLQALKLAARRGPLRRSFAHLRDIERQYVHFRVVKLIDCSARATRTKKFTGP